MALIPRERQADFAKAILELLDQNDGHMRAREILDAMQLKFQLNEAERHRYDSGPSRFEVFVRFISTSLTKAEFIRKARGQWFLTDAGAEKSKLTALELFDLVEKKYRDWKTSQTSNEIPADLDEDLGSAIEMQPAIEKAEEDALSEIRENISEMGPYTFQDLVAALFRGMGYETPFVAPKGPDGGTDILAYLDPLGAKTPHIRVQVKHRQDKATNAEIASLFGNLNPAREIGAFVSSGGFTKEAERQMQRGQGHMELIDLDRFIELWIEHYNNLDDSDKRRLPLKPVYFLTLQK